MKEGQLAVILIGIVLFVVYMVYMLDPEKEHKIGMTIGNVLVFAALTWTYVVLGKDVDPYKEKIY